MPKSALWVGLNMEDSHVGILDVYTPIDMRQRAAFLARDCGWVTRDGLLDCGRRLQQSQDSGGLARERA